MKRALVALVSASLVLACSGHREPAPATPARAPSPPPAASATAPERPARKPLAVPAEISAIIDAPDRSETDRALDQGRHAAELLTFVGVKPGMKVAEIGAGAGYTAELLARAVGPEGKVFGMNTHWVLERFAEKPWTERLTKPAMKNVLRVDGEIDDPLPPEATDLDAVLSVLVYHDLFWLGGDRDKMNAAIFKALKPGGVYVIVDHSGRPGTGSTEVKKLHRIEESVVRGEVERAGFVLREEGGFLRNPDDQRDWNDSPNVAGDRRGTSDRFALKYAKP